MRQKASLLVLGVVWSGALALSATPRVARAEGLLPGPLTIDRAVAYALSHHPRVQAQAASAQGSQAQVSVAQAGYLPELGVSVQLNVGSGNVLRGPLFPMMNIPAVSGPPTGRSLSDMSLGAAVGLGAGETFSGVIRRSARSIDIRTRTMPVELDVDNTAGRLSAGMFAEVSWPVRRQALSLFVPPSAIVQTTEKTYVDRVQDGIIEQVEIKRGVVLPDRVEVFGALQAKDLVLRRGSEDLKSGARVVARTVSTSSH